MTLSAQTRSALERLVISGNGLLQALGTMAAASDPATGARWSDVADNVRRYLATLTAGRSAGDVRTALRGANLLTTVNKGVGDTDTSSEGRMIAERASAVSRDGIEAARHLRADAGMAF